MIKDYKTEQVKTANLYRYPISPRALRKIAYTVASHKVYEDETAIYDCRHAVDFHCRKGTPIMAALGGEVIHITNNDEKAYKGRHPERLMTLDEMDGNFIILKHKNGEYSKYCHLIPEMNVVRGQSVRAEKILGWCGRTGWSLAYHLHFEVFRCLGNGYETLKVRWKEPYPAT